MTDRPRTPAPGPAGKSRPVRRPAAPRTGSRRVSQAASQAPTAIQQSRATFTGRAVVLLLVLLVLAVSYASSARAWLTQRSEINELHAQIKAREAAVADLVETKKRWRDPQFVEQQARLRFGWIMPGEKGYRVLEADGSVLSDGANDLSKLRRMTPAPTQWWQNAWGSVVEAGAEPVKQPTTRVHRPIPVDQIGGKSQHQRPPMHGDIPE